MTPSNSADPITISDDDTVSKNDTQSRAQVSLDARRQRNLVNKSGAKRRHEDDEARLSPGNPSKRQKLASDEPGNASSTANASTRSSVGSPKQVASKSYPSPGITKSANGRHPVGLACFETINLTGSNHLGIRRRDGTALHLGTSADHGLRKDISGANADFANKNPKKRADESVAVPVPGASLKSKAVVQSTNHNLKGPIRPVNIDYSNPDDLSDGFGTVEREGHNPRSDGAQVPRNHGGPEFQEVLGMGGSRELDPKDDFEDVATSAKLQGPLSKQIDSAKEGSMTGASWASAVGDEMQQHDSSRPYPRRFARDPRPAMRGRMPLKGNLTVQANGREIDRSRPERVAGHAFADHARSKALFNHELQQRRTRVTHSDYTLDLDAQIAREVDSHTKAPEGVTPRGDTLSGTNRNSSKDRASSPVTSHPELVRTADSSAKPPRLACIAGTPSIDDTELTSSEYALATPRSPNIKPEQIDNQENDSCRQNSVSETIQRTPSRSNVTDDPASHKQRDPGAEPKHDPPDTNGSIEVPMQRSHSEGDHKHGSYNDVTQSDTIVEQSSKSRPERTTQVEPELSHQQYVRPAVKSSVRIHDLGDSDLSVPERIKHILGSYMEEFREDNDYWIRTWFRRARHSRDQATKSSEAACKGKPTSVFSNMKPRRVVFAEPERLSEEAVELKLEPLRSNNRQGKKFWMVQPDRIRTDTQDLPNYSHYVSIRGNVLAPNDKVMHHWPYISEDPPEGIDSRFHEQYFIDKEDRQRKLRRMLQAESIADYVDNIIREVQCDWCDVLRFLLEPNPAVGYDLEALKAKAARQTSCEEDFSRIASRWVKVLAELPASTPARMARAAFLCDDFLKAAKFSLWHVVRRSDYVKARLPDIRSEHAQGNVTCRVCMRFSCPYHGEIREKDDRRNEKGHADGDSLLDLRSSIREDGGDRISPAEVTVHTDIINPPQVNFRRAVCFPPNGTEKQDRTVTAKDRRSLYYWQTEFPNYLPEDRGPHYPCNHPGVPCKTAECSCFRSKVPCEKSCACAADCPRKFQGCSCAAEKLKKGQKLVCFEDERCLCYQLGRECDADLCGSCGVSHVLDPVHRHDARRPGESCNNASLQRGVRKHTVLGESGVHGLGLYACEDIREHDYVDEYLGEIITINEGERRGAVYEYQKLSYLFSLNKDQDIDGTCFGNKARFINHAGKNKANLYARTRLVNTVYRVGLYATRNIKKGEELFFEYGDKFPDQQLEGQPKGGRRVEKSAAPHVRNTRLVRDEFYDVEQTVDEVGNRRARKVTGTRPAKGGGGGGARGGGGVGGGGVGGGRRRNNNNNNNSNIASPDDIPRPSISSSSSSTFSRRAKPRSARGGRSAAAAVTAAAMARVQATASTARTTPSEGGRAEFFDPAERLETFYVSGEAGDADTEAGAETSDFRPDEGEGDDEGSGAEAGAATSEQESEDDLPRRPGARRARGRGGWRVRR